MAGREDSHLVIYDTRIQAHFAPGGTVTKRANEVGDVIVVEIKARLIPGRGFRTGKLQRSIRKIGKGAMASYSYTINVSANTVYAGWVEHGTNAVILPRNPMIRDPKTGQIISGGLSIPARGGFGHKIVPHVSGQKAQHYMQIGASKGLVASGYRARITVA